MKKNVVFKVVGKAKKKRVVFENESLDECFDFVISILRKERQKAKGKAEKELQNFLDFGLMENENVK